MSKTIEELEAELKALNVLVSKAIDAWSQVMDIDDDGSLDQAMSDLCRLNPDWQKNVLTKAPPMTARAAEKETT